MVHSLPEARIQGPTVRKLVTHRHIKRHPRSPLITDSFRRIRKSSCLTEDYSLATVKGMKGHEGNAYQSSEERGMLQEGDDVLTEGSPAVFVREVDNSFADALANSVIAQQGLQGRAADTIRRSTHGFLTDLEARLRPGAQVPIDAFQPLGSPSSGLYLEKTSHGLVIKKRE